MLEDRSCLLPRSLPSTCEQESTWVYMSYGILNNKHTLIERQDGDEDEEEMRGDSGKRRKSMEFSGASSSREIEQIPDDGNHQGDDGNQQGDDGNHQRDDRDNSAVDDLITPIGRDISIYCLLRSSRSDYGSIASLNKSFRSLIRSGDIYKLRRQMGIVEHWVYFSCNFLEWEAYDPYHGRWITLPRMPPNECFMSSDKESLAVGTELLVFGKEVTSQIVLRYSILYNSWSPGKEMNSPRYLFGSASLGEKAIVAGGTDAHGNILNSAELYNSELQTWETLPSMNRARKMCSGVFMDGKFYVIGGVASKTSSNTEVLTCGEEYDLVKGVWKLIPNMSSGLNGASGAPPLVAVVNNKLYAADYGSKEVREYNKENNSWSILGRLPERHVSVNGWGVAFRACGEQLMFIGGPRGMIELNSWIPNERPPEWNMIASKHSGSFVYNCAVMSC